MGSGGAQALRYFLHRDADLQGAALRLFLRAVEQCLRAHSPGSGPAARLGAVAFIHRFGSTLNAHLHFHCIVIDGVFDAAAAGRVVFHAATGVDANAIAQVQAQVRRRLLRVFVRRGLLPRDDARAMGQWAHGGGFSVDGSVRIEAADRAGRERLLRYCARPPFALDRLRELDPEHLVYDPPKPGPGGSAPQCLTPLELLDRLAALVPLPRVHRHRYFGVLAPNSPLRAAVTALAPVAVPTPPAHPPAARRCGKPPALRTIPPLIRCSSPPRPSSSTSASAGSHYRHRRCSPVGSARQARAGPRQPPRARPPWRRRPPECAITSGRRSLSPPQVDA
jgi:hypothetical protein